MEFRSSSGSFDCYKIIGVKQDSNFAEIKKAYYKRVKECHPDLFGGSPGKEEEFKMLVAAFDVLSDPEKRRRLDERLGITSSQTQPGAGVFSDEDIPVMDTEYDDAIEEFIVGNDPPKNTTLATLFLDLQKTEVFIEFREGRYNLAQGKPKAALIQFNHAIAHSPNNILYRYYAARAYLACGDYSNARKQLHAAINIGERRDPPQRLLRIRRELEKINKKHFSLSEKILSFFRAKLAPEPFYRVSEEMIDETNRAIAKISSERKKKNEERKLLNK